MSFYQDQGSDSEGKSEAITGTEIVVYVPKMEKKPTFAEAWKHMSQKSILEIVDSRRSRIKFSPFPSEGSASNEALAITPISSRQPKGSSIRTTEQSEADEAAKQATIPCIRSNSRFSSSDRQQHWMSQERQRPNGRFDTYYYHRMANCVFRSKIEVTNFVLHETYPRRPQKSNKHKSKDINQELPGYKDGPKHSSSKRKRDSSQAVEEFLNEAHNNLLNYFNGKENKQRVEEEPMPQTVEEFLAEARWNLENLDKITGQGSKPNDTKQSVEGAMPRAVEEFLAEAHQNLKNLDRTTSRSSKDYYNGRTKARSH